MFSQTDSGQVRAEAEAEAAQGSWWPGVVAVAGVAEGTASVDRTQLHLDKVPEPLGSPRRQG